jgi:hypothetical protein
MSQETSFQKHESQEIKARQPDESQAMSQQEREAEWQNIAADKNPDKVDLSKNGAPEAEQPGDRATDQIKELGPLEGKSKAEIEAQLKERDYTGVSAENKGVVWTKPGSDGYTSAVRIDPPNENSPEGYADARHHIHKETVLTAKVKDGNYSYLDRQTYDDSGNPTRRDDYHSNHIRGGH